MARRDRPERREERPTEDLRAERRVRALEEPMDVRVRPDPRFLQIEVRNPVHRTRYDVLFPAYPSRDYALCTCTDFARRGIGTCKHVEAAWLWLAEHPQPEGRRRPARGGASPRTWKEIDRRLGAAEGAPRPAALRLRWPGAVLISEN